MDNTTKGRSPFYPGQPVPVELFAGRVTQINRIVERGVQQVELGKPATFFVEGEYGIGKSSFASYVQRIAEENHNLHTIYVQLGGAVSIEDVTQRIMQETILTRAFDPSRSEKIRTWLAKYVGKQEVLGVTVNLENLKPDLPSISTNIVPFIEQIVSHLQDGGVRGVFLVLDEINGISSNPQFSQFVKGIVDTNALRPNPVPLLLMLCGVKERRLEMISKHPPVDRIFDVIEFAPMSNDEMRAFFSKAFQSVGMNVTDGAMNTFLRWSDGFPKIMHLMGDSAFWIDRDGSISEEDATFALIETAMKVGKMYVEPLVYDALQSESYRSILAKIGRDDSTWIKFFKQNIEPQLSSSEKSKFNNFLQKMKKLNVIKSGESKGEYIFVSPMTRMFIRLQSASTKD